jgi:hypothetical protein
MRFYRLDSTVGRTYNEGVMRRTLVLITLAMAATASSYADSPLSTRREKALEGIQTCLHRNEVSSRECKHFNKDVQTLVEVYRGGDKSVLPTLLRFTYLTDFYDEALLSDPDGFLSAMNQLPAKDQKAVAAGIAGGRTFGLRDAERFKAIREALRNVPEASPTKAVAEVSLKIVEATNAGLFVNYFPPRTFTGRAANFQVAWYSSDMYQLGETPLWPPSPHDENTYRFTYLGAFTGPKAVTLTVLTDGGGQIRMSVLDESHDRVKSEQTLTVPKDRVSEFLRRVDGAHFWEMASESQHRGFDGAEWIMEGVQESRYHIAVRWCPDSEDAAFADTARFLFQLAGYKHQGSC